ncbi:MAG: hypothetical protein ACREBF_01910, partial [Candidatus Micrarchaeales archaeon]
MKNITTPLGGICIVDKIENDFGLISKLFEGIMSNEYMGRAKLLLNNRLTYTTSVRQILPLANEETISLFGIKKVSERSLYRTVDKIGMLSPIILGRYQKFIKEN